MPVRVGLVGTPDECPGAPVTLLGGEFVGDGPAALLAPLRANPFGQFAFGADLGVGERVVEGGVVLEGKLAARGRDLLRECRDLGVRRADGIIDRPLVGHLAPSGHSNIWTIEHMCDCQRA
ncbi:hypothetical protein [Nocardia neocaledoniensis]|nr:hypothetical protein [Nocardia neocaledoniensis]